MGSNQIYNHDKIARVVSFEGLPHVGSCSPTDIDFCIEVGANKKFLIGDLKESGKELNVGQRLLIERVCGAFAAYGYDAIGFLAWHLPSVEIIVARDAIVAKFYHNGSWVDVANEAQTLGKRYAKYFGISNDEPGISNDEPSVIDEIWDGVVPV